MRASSRGRWCARSPPAARSSWSSCSECSAGGSTRRASPPCASSRYSSRPSSSCNSGTCSTPKDSKPDARRAHGIAHSRTFLTVLALIALGQWLIVELGGEVFRTVPLSWQEWGLDRGAHLAHRTGRRGDPRPAATADVFVPRRTITSAGSSERPPAVFRTKSPAERTTFASVCVSLLRFRREVFSL